MGQEKSFKINMDPIKRQLSHQIRYDPLPGACERRFALIGKNIRISGAMSKFLRTLFFRKKIETPNSEESECTTGTN